MSACTAFYDEQNLNDQYALRRFSSSENFAQFFKAASGLQYGAMQRQGQRGPVPRQECALVGQREPGIRLRTRIRCLRPEIVTAVAAVRP